MIQRLARRYREAFSGVPRKVWLIALILLVSRSGTMVLPFLAIYCRQELGFQPAAIGWLLSAYGVGSVVAGLAGGKLTHRIGAVPTQIVSLVMAIPGFLVVGMVRDFNGLLAALFYLSLGVEMMRPACTTATVEFCTDESQHTRAFAVNRLAINLGMTLGPAVGGFLALVNYQLLFYANAVSTLGALLLTLYFFGWRPTGESSPSASPDPSRPAAAASPFRDGRFIWFCLLNTAAACVLFQFLGTYPLYLKEQYHLQENHIGLLFAVNTVVIVLFELVLVTAIAGYPLLRTFAWGQLLSCVGFGILPFAVGSPFAAGALYCVFSMLVLTLGEMLTSPLGPAYTARRSTPANRGRYMGVYITSFSLAVLIAPVTGMWMYDRNPHLVWYAGLIIGGVVFFCLLRLADREQTAAPAGH
jgi:MFS family permease